MSRSGGADYYDRPHPRRRKREKQQSLAIAVAFCQPAKTAADAALDAMNPVTVAVAKPCAHLYPRYGDRSSPRATGSCIRVELSHRTAAGGRGPSSRRAGTGLWVRYTNLGTEAVWAQVQNIERRANKCFRRHMDEHAWCDVVQLVLQLALGVAGGANPNFALEINNVQSQAVDSAFLPQIRKYDGGGLRHVDKRIDFAIGVDTETGLHIDADPEQLFLSPMTDAYTATLPLVCGLEVKRLDGSEEEAQLQLMVWQTAMLAHLDYLRKIGGSPDLPLPPVVAWTVTNHSWRLYVAWKQLDDAVHVMRPFAQSTAASSAGTKNTASIFILLKLWTKLISWFETDYYPAYQALLRQTDQAQKAIDPLEL
ncbi:hypothetical protein D6C78_07769 [Aureobasidium pullulans]|uniref:PD-(D/E)XK nuclease-like domain-containing protein n=1 Tax=Aureobasidium pullulans TaxID=5580 RepID=A0A4T0BFK9_AURPU|nr:hypothetical protein D6C78_07769 [Aureobasidium pullulans]